MEIGCSFVTGKEGTSRPANQNAFLPLLQRIDFISLKEAATFYTSRLERLPDFQLPFTSARFDFSLWE